MSLIFRKFKVQHTFDLMIDNNFEIHCVEKFLMQKPIKRLSLNSSFHLSYFLQSFL